MYYTNQIKQKKSLGYLKENRKTKPRSPDLTGKLRIEQHTLETLKIQCDGGKERDGVAANIAGWWNYDDSGRYLTVELQPSFTPKRNYEDHYKTNSLESLFNNGEMEETN